MPEQQKNKPTYLFDGDAIAGNPERQVSVSSATSWEAKRLTVKVRGAAR